MNISNSPAMSVVIITPDNFETIRRTIDCIKVQTVKHTLELVVVNLSSEDLEVYPEELDVFNGFRIIKPVGIVSYWQALTAGVKSSSAQIVAFTQDHVFPDPLWAEVLTESHKSNRAAVGPVIYNANPDDPVGWADILIGYSQWLYPNHGGEMNHLPGHNSSYKRHILLEYGSELERLLEAESVLHWDLISKGYKLYLEPAAKVYHLNFGVLSTLVKVHYYTGIMFAASRCQSWPRLKRASFALGSLLIPVIRIYRIVKNYSGSLDLFKTKPQVYPILVLGLLMSSIGEMMGYVSGSGNSLQKTLEYHFHRDLYVKK
jgi:Glycosyl transferase family 2